MSDMARAAQAAAGLIDKLESELAEGEAVGDIMLIVEVRTEDDDGAYMRWHCTTERFLIQAGMVSWANAALLNPQIRTTDNDEDEDDGEA